MYNPFFNKYKYKLERAYELICYMILNYNPKNSIDKHRQEGLEQARRVLVECMERIEPPTNEDLEFHRIRQNINLQRDCDCLKIA